MMSHDVSFNDHSDLLNDQIVSDAINAIVVT